MIIQVFSDVSHNPFSYRILKLADSEILSNMISAQPEEDLQYFHPHGLDPGSVRKQFGKDAFLMMGVFDGNKIVGYFFLRFLIIKLTAIITIITTTRKTAKKINIFILNI